ncbi:MAG: pyridoxamine 5'-phosphate oxidase family protein [Hyphomicrobiaceae bacterium]|nr:pyridoxamine 5'-phosphate oxidase family protein [Hyphomicrobiaceae bacterium]
MSHRYHDIAFTPAVKALQEELGSRAHYARAEAQPETHGLLGPDEAAFITTRNSFYMATVSETGWPYMQHRGGPAGFLKVLDERTIGFADYAGNRQYVSTGNLAGNNKVSLFLMDYPMRARLKILGHARIVQPMQTAVIEALAVPGYRARVERGILIEVAGFDWNCQQHITPRFTLAEIEAITARNEETQ